MTSNSIPPNERLASSRVYLLAMGSAKRENLSAQIYLSTGNITGAASTFLQLAATGGNFYYLILFVHLNRLAPFDRFPHRAPSGESKLSLFRSLVRVTAAFWGQIDKTYSPNPSRKNAPRKRHKKEGFRPLFIKHFLKLARKLSKNLLGHCSAGGIGFGGAGRLKSGSPSLALWIARLKR